MSYSIIERQSIRRKWADCQEAMHQRRALCTRRRNLQRNRIYVYWLMNGKPFASFLGELALLAFAILNFTAAVLGFFR